MEFNEYQTEARAFRASTATQGYIAFGLLAEAGEVADKIAKALRDGSSDDYPQQVAKELGDILWFISSMADDLDISLEDIAQGNIDKLTDRLHRNVIHGSGDNR